MAKKEPNTAQVVRDAVRTGPVVVGFDNSPGARAALEFAAAQAKVRGVGLRVVSAFHLVVSDLGIGAGVPWELETIEAIRRAAHDDAQEAARWAASAHPELPVEVAVAPGPAAGVLLEQTKDAGLVVLGSHGRGGFLDLLLGGTAREVATHQHAPTVVVRTAEPKSDRVVVGIDGSPDSLRALAFAFDMASRTGGSLTAVHTWDVPPIGALTGVPSPEPPALVREVADVEVRAALEELAGFAEQYPDVQVEHKVLRGAPVPLLVAEAADAGLLVVGSRGRGGFVGLLLGSVSHGVLHHAAGNVAVVRS
jgi:nucleotide-binding universal stress UspA family protein